MSEAGAPVRRGAGRPTREQAAARHEELLETALDLFLENGFDVTTVEMIASRVNMTKRTIYARYPEKSTLFLAAVHRAVDGQIVPPEVLEQLDTGDLKQTLEAVARLRIDQVMTSNGLRLQRIINTEGYRFPEIFVANYERSAGPVIDFVAGVLDRAIAAGTIAPIDTDQAARAFMSMVVGGQVRTIVAGRPPSAAQLEERVGFTVRLLLDGLRPR